MPIMNGSNLRMLFAGLLLASTAWLISWEGKSASGQVVVQPIGPGGIVGQPGKGKKDKDKKDERPEEDKGIPFAFPYERDSKNQLKAARDYLEFKEVPWNTVC